MKTVDSNVTAVHSPQPGPMLYVVRKSDSGRSLWLDSEPIESVDVI